MASGNNKRGRPSKGGSKLNAENILMCAKAVMATKGAPPSIRQLAQALDVDAMAIYYYYKNKASLLEAIAVSLIDDIYNPQSKENWQLELMQLSLSYLTLLEQYQGLLETLLSMDSEGPARVFFMRLKSILSPLALTEEVEEHTLNLLVDYLHGYALAMRCNKDLCQNQALLSGPLGLICAGVASYVK
mgnify:CR=1 FL=1